MYCCIHLYYIYFLDNPERCTAVFINKGITVDVAGSMITVEWEGTGPGVAPEETVDLFTCEINDNAPIPCESSLISNYYFFF